MSHQRILAAWLLILVGIAWLATGAAQAAADYGRLEVTCDGGPGETAYLAEQKDTTIENGCRVINGDGYVIYRMPVGGLVPERISYTIGQERPFALEFSADGKQWHSMVTMEYMANPRERYVGAANGFTPEWQAAARQTGMAWFRISRAPGNNRPGLVRSLAFEVSGQPIQAPFTAAARPPQQTGDHGNPLPQFRIPEPIAILPGVLMLLVGVLAVALFRRRWDTPLRLFWLGAALWTVSVAVKMVVAITANKPVEAALHRGLPGFPGQLAFWVYIGLLTGMTECVIFPCLAGFWRRRQWRWRDAASVGVGFGAFEAALLGVGAMLAGIYGLGSPATLGVAFAPPTERVIALVVHVATAMMLIHAVIARRWGWFWTAFVYKSGVDAVAGYLLISGRSLLANPWLVELGFFAPFALLAVPLLWYLRRQWQESAEAKPAEEASMPPSPASGTG